MVAVPSLAVRCVRVFTMSLHMASAAYTLVQWPLPLLEGGAAALVLHTLCRFPGLCRHPFILVQPERAASVQSNRKGTTSYTFY